MSISSRFSVGIHILSLVVIEEEPVTSESIAGSVNTNATVIRKIIGMLRKADLVKTRHGVAGVQLMSPPEEISLLAIYKAVAVVEENELFSTHDNPNPDCIVGKNIQETIEPIFQSAQIAMEKQLNQYSLQDVITGIVSIE